MTAGPMEADLARSREDTVGERLYHQRGIRGIRGEAALGLPSVEQIGLPIYRWAMEQGLGKNDSGCLTLLHLIARVRDTNMISRGGLELAQEAMDRVGALLTAKEIPDMEDLFALDDWFIQRNLSPGGCADLLAAVFFLSQL